MRSQLISLTGSIRTINDKMVEKNIYLYIYICFAVLFVALTIIGGYIYYSPVPLWDTWGMIGFYDKFVSGDWSSLWSLHNEHRIIFTRILFLINYAINGESFGFLIICNYILLSLLTLLYVFIWKEIKNKNYYSILFIIAFSFLWEAQNGNLFWEFQSQFIGIYLFSLSAFFFLYKASINQEKFIFYFTLSIIFSIISIGTLANGILVLPLMILYAFLTKFPKKYIVLLCVLFIVLVSFHIDVSSRMFNSRLPTKAPLLEAFFENPFQYVQFCLGYIGNPFSKNSFVCQALGAFYTITTLCFIYTSFFKEKLKNKLHLFLLTCICFYFLTVIVTALGRAHAAFAQALVPRYMTVSVFGWILFLLLAISKKHAFFSNKYIPIIGICILSFFLPSQCKLSDPLHPGITSVVPSLAIKKDIAALALSLNIIDSKRILIVYPRQEFPISHVKLAQKNKISIFSHGKIKELSDIIMNKKNCIYTLNQETGINIQGSINRLEKIINEDKKEYEDWMFISGAIESDNNNSFDKLYILDVEFRLIGVALKSRITNDFNGYMKPVMNPNVYIYSPDLNSAFQATLPKSNESILTPLFTTQSCTGSLGNYEIVDNLIRIQGWLIDNLEEKTLPDETFLVTYGKDDTEQWTPLDVTHRPDVANHFKIPEFATAGYSGTVLHPSAVEKIAIGMRIGDEYYTCQP